MQGSYHNYFHVYDRNGKQDRCIEASKTPKKKPARPMPKLRGKASPAKEDEGETDLDKKVLHCSWHPSSPIVAVAALNTVYVYTDDGTTPSL